jgi:hypothetical protein
MFSTTRPRSVLRDAHNDGICLAAIATWGARKVLRNAIRADFSSDRSLLNLFFDSLPSPSCRSMALSKVGEPPSWKYGAESATPHSGGVFHSPTRVHWRAMVLPEPPRRSSISPDRPNHTSGDRYRSLRPIRVLACDNPRTEPSQITPRHGELATPPEDPTEGFESDAVIRELLFFMARLHR